MIFVYFIEYDFGFYVHILGFWAIYSDIKDLFGLFT